MSSRLAALGRHLSLNDIQSKKPIKVTVTGAAGNIGYALVFMIAQGRMFGPNQPIDLTLLELKQAQQALKGVIMELKDCAFPLIHSLQGTIEYETAFKNCEVALLVGARPRGPGMERKDLLKANAGIFKGQGEALDKFADKNVRVCVVGNPANTNAMITSLQCKRINPNNITALTRLDQNRAMA